MRLRYISFSFIISLLVGCIALTVIVGWYLHIPVLVQISSSLTPMQFNTALALFVWSVVLQLVQAPARPFSVLLTVGMNIFLILTLLEYIFQVDFGIDTLFVNPFVQTNIVDVGRMAPNTVVALLAIGASLLLLHQKVIVAMNHKRMMAIIFFGMVGFSLGVIPLVGYSNKLETAYTWGHFTRMAVHTAACIALLGLGVLILAWKNIVNRIVVAPASIIFGGAFLAGLIALAIYSQENIYFENSLQLKADNIASVATVQWQDFYKSLDRMRDRWKNSKTILKDPLKRDAENYIKDFPYLKMIGWADEGARIQWLVPDKGYDQYLQYKIQQAYLINKGINKKTSTLFVSMSTGISQLENNGIQNAMYVSPIVNGEIDKGYLVVQIDVPQFFNQLLSLIQMDKNLFVSIYENNVLIFSTIQAASIALDPELIKWQKNAEFTDGNRLWVVVVSPTKAILAEKYTATPWVVLFVGLLTSIIGAVAVFFTLKWQQSSRLLEAAQKLNDAVMDSAAYSIIATDAQGKIFLFNRYAQQALKYSEEEVLSSGTPAMWHDEEQVKKRAAELTEQLGREIQPGFDVFVAEALLKANENREWTFIRKDKTTFPGLLVVTPLKSESGDIIGFLGIIQDLTERKQVEQQLKKYTNDLERKNQDILQLNELSNNLQACTTIDETYEPIRLYCQQSLKVTKGILYVFNKGTTQLEDVIDWGYDPLHKKSYFNIGDCRALRFKKIYQVVHPDVDIICKHAKMENESLPYLCIPIQSHFDILGLLYLEMPKGPYDFLALSTSGLVQLMAEQLALSFISLELRENLRMQSVHDPLTGLYNRRYLESTIKQEIASAGRYHLTFGVMMIDIDFFKNINDSLGHQAGDQVLKMISHLFLECVREEDIACRWGGEEFLLYFKNISIDALFEKAEKLRLAVMKLEMQIEGVLVNGLAISIGLALYPSNGNTLNMLVASADRALYQAKNTGRNKVVVASLS